VNLASDLLSVCVVTQLSRLERYEVEDPENPDPRFLSLHQALARRNRSETILIRGFKALSIALRAGFESVAYESHLREDGTMFWLSDAHARALASILPERMAYFALVITTVENDAFAILADATREGARIKELLVKHTSGDEVTASEARSLARWITRARVRSFHLWAGEYEEGALDAFCDELLWGDNRTLCELDVCLTTLPEPADRRCIPRLDEMLAINTRRSRKGGASLR
jgi:hypothetical protein